MDQVTEGSYLNTNKLEISSGHHFQSLYLGNITATTPLLLPLVFLPALSGFFISGSRESSSTRFVVKSSPTALNLLLTTDSTPNIIGGGDYENA